MEKHWLISSFRKKRCQWMSVVHVILWYRRKTNGKTELLRFSFLISPQEDNEIKAPDSGCLFCCDKINQNWRWWKGEWTKLNPIWERQSKWERRKRNAFKGKKAVRPGGRKYQGYDEQAINYAGGSWGLSDILRSDGMSTYEEAIAMAMIQQASLGDVKDGRLSWRTSDRRKVWLI